MTMDETTKRTTSSKAIGYTFKESKERKQRDGEGKCEMCKERREKERNIIQKKLFVKSYPISSISNFKKKIASKIEWMMTEREYKKYSKKKSR